MLMVALGVKRTAFRVMGVQVMDAISTMWVETLCRVYGACSLTKGR